MSQPSKQMWVDVVGRETVITVVERNHKTASYGRRTVTTKVVETTEEPYVVFSCGHKEREINFSSKGKDRKRLRCWDCEKLFRDIPEPSKPVEQKQTSEA